MKRWLLLMLVAGCNQVFDLDPTVGPAELDSDLDGVPDDADNCVLVPNEAQANGDDDVFGDVCDPCPAGAQSGQDDDADGIDDECDECPRGSNHNEDGDSILDGCDTCPGIADEDQLDTDADGVGDACDPSLQPNRRVLFDGFAPPDPQWNTGFNEWQTTADGWQPTTYPQAEVGPWLRRAEVTGTGWQITVGIRPAAAPLGGMFTGVGVIDAQAPTAPRPTCTSAWADGTWHAPLDDTPISLSGPFRISLRAMAPSTGIISPLCLVNDMPFPQASQYVVPEKFFAVLELHYGFAEFEWIDVIQ